MTTLVTIKLIARENQKAQAFAMEHNKVLLAQIKAQQARIDKLHEQLRNRAGRNR